MQILLDDERYRRLEREAASSGRSVASIVRAAIDVHLATGGDARAEAGRRFIAEHPAASTGRQPDWAESKRELATGIDELLLL